MTIYIAGKITGDPDYKAKFARAEKALTSINWIVLNPAVHPEGLPRDAYMHIDMAMIDVADMIYFLPDWEDSEGARLEMQYVKYQSRDYVIGDGIY